MATATSVSFLANRVEKRHQTRGLPSLLRLCAACSAQLFTAARAQVQNLRFDDTDTASGTIDGIVYWERPAAGDSDVTSYEIYLSQDSSGSGQSQLGRTLGGAWYSEFSIPNGTSASGFSYLIVYLRQDSLGVSLGSPAYICLHDNPSDRIRTMYLTSLGYSNAVDMKTALVSGCHAPDDKISIRMVATSMWAGSLVETTFDDSNEESSTATFSLIFPTGSTLTAVNTAVSAYSGMSLAPAVYIGTGASSGTYRLAQIQFSTDVDGFGESSTDLQGFAVGQPDPDVGRWFGRSCVMQSIASFSMVDRFGLSYVWTTSTSESAVNDMLNVFQGWNSPVWNDLDAESSTLSSIAGRANVASPTCWQVAGTTEDVSNSCL